MAAALQSAVFALVMTIAFASTRSNLTRARTPDCVSPGFFCPDCRTLVLCVEYEDTFARYKMDECSDKTYCSSSLKACSTKDSLCTLDRKFLCVQQGRFPDPYDCNLYHDCIKDSDGYSIETYTCDGVTSFNPKTGKCDLPADEASCGEGAYPVPRCIAGEKPTSGLLKLDPSYIWVCIDGVIYMHKCKEGTIYDNNGGCRKEDKETTDDTSKQTSEENSKETSEQTSEESSEGTSEEPPSGEYQCVGSWKEPDPLSCTRYYDCSDPQRPVRFSCPWPKYFHHRKAKCVLGICPY